VVCVECKKMRDKEAGWVTVSPSELSLFAVISHGICRECAEVLYPEYFRKENAGGTRTDTA